MTLRTMFALLYGSIVLIASLLALISWIASDRVRERTEDVAILFERVRLAEELQIHLLNTNREWFLARVTGDEEHTRNSVEEEEEVRTTLMQLSRMILVDSDREAIAEATRAAENYLDTVSRVSSRDLEPTLAYQEVNPALRNAHEIAAELTKYSLDQAALGAERSHTGARVVGGTAITVLLICTILFPFGWILVRNGIYRPIQELISAILRFREGGHREPIHPTGIKEVRDAAEAFDDLTWRLSDQRNASLRFLASIAHDFKNPLSGIKLSADLLGRAEWPKDKQKQMAELISRQADQLNRMVGDFLDASRIQAGELELHRSPQDLRAIIEDSVLLYRQTSDRHRILYDPGDEPLVCNVDATRVNQVLNNLLSNAIKYSPNGGEIRVSLERDENSALVRVRDQGIGIPKNEIPKIFEPFRRARQTKETIPGVGLGLSVAKRIVESHGGAIEIESEPGVGSTFSLRIPLMTEASAQQRAG